jgi:outer membrane protein
MNFTAKKVFTTFVLTQCINSVTFAKENLSTAPTSPCIIKSLNQALQAAYGYNVELEQQRRKLKELVEGIAIATSEWNPSLNFSASQQAAASSSKRENRGADIINNFVFGNIKEFNGQKLNQSALQLQAKQNLYSGGGTTARIKKAKNDFKYGLCSLVSQEQNSFYQVVEAYVDAAVAQYLLEVQKIFEQHQKERFEETKVRYEIGDQKIFDVEVAKSNLADSTVGVTNAQAQVQLSRAHLEALIGAPLGQKLAMPEVKNTFPKSLDKLQQTAIRSFPILIGLTYSERAARMEASSIMSGLLPRVDLNANAGPTLTWSKDRSLNKQRFEGYVNSRNSNIQNQATVGLTLSVPIVTNGEIQARYRLAEQKVKEVRLETESNRRQVLKMCQTFYFKFKAAQENLTSTKVALDSVSVALDVGKEEYLLGIISILDVSQIEYQWLNRYRQYIQAVSDVVKLSYQILQVTGQLTSSSLGLKICEYDPCWYYEKYNNAWFSLGEDEETNKLFSIDQKPSS